MKLMLLTKAMLEKLEHNAQQVRDGRVASGDLEPVVKLSNPYGSGTWLITELHDGDRLFGLCYRGNGSPEPGYQSLRELEQVRAVIWGRQTNIQAIERATRWSAGGHTLSEFAEVARNRGEIVDRLPCREAA